MLPDSVLPDYVVIDDEADTHREVLRTPAEEVTFPLSSENEKVLQDLKQKFDQEPNCLGLAAPQIGYGKRMIIYHIPEDAKSLRDDLYEVLPPTVLINPTYQPLTHEKRLDWEGCFSVQGTMGEVPRYTQIAYQAFDPSGKRMEGIAKGFQARVLQHEIGHINGELFIDLITDECRSGPIEQMRALRMAEREAREKQEEQQTLQ